jgi:hypothetical protein
MQMRRLTLWLPVAEAERPVTMPMRMVPAVAVPVAEAPVARATVTDTDSSSERSLQTGTLTGAVVVAVAMVVTAAVDDPASYSEEWFGGWDGQYKQPAAAATRAESAPDACRERETFPRARTTDTAWFGPTR